MGKAKEIIVQPIDCADARRLVKRLHYSGKFVNNSQLHLGIIYRGKVEGSMQFGPSMDKRKVQGLVASSGWHNFLELNRMAFSDRLPRNSESRALGVAMRILRKKLPQLKWIISFSDATQCGDGTIYRAAGFVLTGIKKNCEVYIAPDGQTYSQMTITSGDDNTRWKILKNYPGAKKSMLSGKASMDAFKAVGFKPLEGYQLRYIYFLDPAWRKKLTVPELPFSEIDRQGAGMYKGEKRRVSSSGGAAADVQSAEGGSTPTGTLHKT